MEHRKLLNSLYLIEKQLRDAIDKAVELKRFEVSANLRDSKKELEKAILKVQSQINEEL
jgi:protein-arginine kinase activator protein McsA